MSETLNAKDSSAIRIIQTGRASVLKPAGEITGTTDVNIISERDFFVVAYYNDNSTFKPIPHNIIISGTPPQVEEQLTFEILNNVITFRAYGGTAAKQAAEYTRNFVFIVYDIAVNI